MLFPGVTLDGVRFPPTPGVWTSARLTIPTYLIFAMPAVGWTEHLAYYRRTVIPHNLPRGGHLPRVYTVRVVHHPHATWARLPAAAITSIRRNDLLPTDSQRVYVFYYSG